MTDTDDDALDPYLTVQEIAKLLKVHEWTVREWVKRRDLKAFRLGDAAGLRIRRSDFLRFRDVRFTDLEPAKIGKSSPGEVITTEETNS